VTVSKTPTPAEAQADIYVVLSEHEFDRFFRERRYTPGEEGRAMADWLSEQVGEPVIGESDNGDIVIGELRDSDSS
jgi:hypothetical protein